MYNLFYRLFYLHKITTFVKIYKKKMYFFVIIISLIFEFGPYTFKI